MKTVTVIVPDSWNRARVIHTLQRQFDALAMVESTAAIYSPWNGEELARDWLEKTRPMMERAQQSIADALDFRDLNQPEPDPFA